MATTKQIYIFQICKKKNMKLLCYIALKKHDFIKNQSANAKLFIKLHLNIKSWSFHAIPLK